MYLRSDNDIQRLVTNLFKNTTPKGSQSQDPFWDQAATMLLLALIFYLHYEAPPEEQNFPMVMEMIRAGEVREDDETYKSALDILFERLEIVILAAAPFGALGFFSYHGMSAGRFLRVWFRSEILEPAHLRVQPTNLYYEALKGVIEAHEREVYKRHDKDPQ